MDDSQGDLTSADNGNDEAMEKVENMDDEEKSSDTAEMIIDEIPKKKAKVKPKAPQINCPEHIVIFLDISTDWSTNEATVVRGMSRNQILFQLLKKAIAIFLKTKSTINPKHQFALVLLQDNAVLWYQELTNDVQLFLEMMADLELSETDLKGKSELSLDQMIQVLKDHCELPPSQDIILPPDFILRTILIYGRSKCEIDYSDADLKDLDEFHSSPYFFFDCLYIHEEPSEDNKCEDIFSFLRGLNEDGSGLILDVCNDSTVLFEQMAKLLAHPLQRSTDATTYSLLPEKKDADATVVDVTE